MKRKTYLYTMLLLLSTLAVSCVEKLPDIAEPQRRPVVTRNQISPAAISDAQDDMPPLATRSLIDAQAAHQIQSQFLRIDEEIDTQNKGKYTYTGWDKGYVMEASVISSPGNQDDQYMRSVLLNPVQSYKIRVTHDEVNHDITDTTFYHTRMISWYPITCVLHKQEGVASVTRFDHFKTENVGYDAYSTDADGNFCINFFDLDGSKDIMVTEVREGQHWHNPTKRGHDGNGGKHPSDYMPDDQSMTGTSIYREPFGRNQENPGYHNCFKYKHFLSAVRVHAYAENSEQNAAMWGRITQVVVRNQPKNGRVSIPSSQEFNPNERTYGKFEALDHDAAFPIIKTDIFDDTNADSQQIAPENPSLDGTSSTNKLYLGYALVGPDENVTLDIHTESGIYSVTVDKTQTLKKKDGTDSVTVDVFKGGYIYDVTLNFGTGGTIAAMLLHDSEGKYYDLTLGKLFKAEDTGGETKPDIFKYKIANCYIVDPSEPIKDDQDQPLTPTEYYDGYTFLANVIGNGPEGLIKTETESLPNKTTAIRPVTAGLIWESSLGLITQVEYMYNYIRFKVGKPGADGKFKKGNAVIGAYDANGNVLWSWHIWVTDRPADMKYKLGGSTTVTLMDRNLGATEGYIESSGQRPADWPLCTYGLYYQWGRKDPTMPPPEANYRPLSTATSTYYDYYGNELNSTSTLARAQPTVDDAVKNPMYIILPTSIPQFYEYDWLYERNDILWGHDKGNEKTIYDPCPFGYRVPGNEISSLLLQNHTPSQQVESNSWVFNDIDNLNGGKKISFPFAGYKGVDRGMSSLTAAWKYVGEKGDYMSKLLHTNQHRLRTYISRSGKWKETGADANEDGVGDSYFEYQNTLFTDYTNRRTAASIRCITDEFLGDLGSIMASFTGPLCVFLNETPKPKLVYKAEAKDAAFKNIVFTKELKGGTPITETVVPDANPYTREFVIPGTEGSNPKDYDAIGQYTYTAQASNVKGVGNTRTTAISVINIEEVYSMKLNEESPRTGNFQLGKNGNFSFQINMREKGDGRNTTTVNDLELLFNTTETWINDVHIKSNFDANTKTFTTEQAIPLTEKITMECRRKSDGRVMKKYELTGSAVYATKRLTDQGELTNGKYYGFAENIDDGEKKVKKWWEHNGGTEMLTLIEKGKNGNDSIKDNNLFRFDEVTGKDNRAGYLLVYKANTHMDKNFKVQGEKYYFNIKNNPSQNGNFRIYRDTDRWFSSQKGLMHTTGGLFDREIKFRWGPPGSTNEAKIWYIYEITPKIQYTKLVDVTDPNNPVEITDF